MINELIEQIGGRDRIFEIANLYDKTLSTGSQASVITGYIGAKPKPPWARWQAVDLFGNVMVFATKPVYRDPQWYPDSKGPFCWVNLCVPVPPPEKSLLEI